MRDIRNSHILRRLAVVLVLASSACSEPAGTPSGPVAAELRLVSGGDQVGNPLEALQHDVTIRVLDGDGSAIPDAAVSLTIVAGDGLLSAQRLNADAQGTVHVRWTLGPRTGAQQMRASVVGADSVHTLVSATARQQLLVSLQGSALTLVNLENTAQKILVAQAAAMDAAWSPDGRRIAFTGRPDNGVNDRIYIMNAEGTGVTPISTPGAAFDGEVDWSPDGKRLVFTRVLDGVSRIFAIDPDGRNLAQLSTSQSGTPRWSPDGSRIAYSVQSASHWSMEIAVMNADGTGARSLTANQTDDLGPDWSPDGSQLVYHGWREGRPRLFIINVDGTGDRLLTSDVPANHLYDAEAAWSRDGAVIAFGRATDDPAGTTYSTGLYTIRPDGTGLTEVARAQGAMDSPRWRP